MDMIYYPGYTDLWASAQRLREILEILFREEIDEAPSSVPLVHMPVRRVFSKQIDVT